MAQSASTRAPKQKTQIALTRFSHRMIKSFFTLSLTTAFFGCNVLPGAETGGTCTTADGAVNTYTIYGTWKQVSGYSPARSEKLLEVDYDILMVLRNGEVCKLEVLDGADTGALQTVALGTHQHIVDLKKINLNLSQDVRSSRTDPVVTYSFRDSCRDTKMTWSYPDGKTEVFQYRSKNTDGLSCTVAPE